MFTFILKYFITVNVMFLITETLNDGVWHRTMLTAADNYVELVVDRKPVRIRRSLKVRTGNRYLIGGKD